MTRFPYLSIFSSGLPFFKYRRAFVRWSFKITASCRSLPMSKFFSLTSLSNGRARSRSLDIASSDVLASVARSSASRSCFWRLSTCAWEFSTSSRSSRLRAIVWKILSTRDQEGMGTIAYRPGSLAMLVVIHLPLATERLVPTLPFHRLHGESRAALLSQPLSP